MVPFGATAAIPGSRTQLLQIRTQLRIVYYYTVPHLPFTLTVRFGGTAGGCGTSRGGGGGGGGVDSLER